MTEAERARFDALIPSDREDIQEWIVRRHNSLRAIRWPERRARMLQPVEKPARWPQAWRRTVDPVTR